MKLFVNLYHDFDFQWLPLANSMNKLTKKMTIISSQKKKKIQRTVFRLKSEISDFSLRGGNKHNDGGQTTRKGIIG